MRLVGKLSRQPGAQMWTGLITVWDYSANKVSLYVYFKGMGAGNQLTFAKNSLIFPDRQLLWNVIFFVDKFII